MGKYVKKLRTQKKRKLSRQLVKGEKIGGGKLGLTRHNLISLHENRTEWK
jgi:hypothetical protein